MKTVVEDLKSHQVNTFFEAVGHMVAAMTDAGNREKCVLGMMSQPNAMLTDLMTKAAGDVSVLNDMNGMRMLSHILRMNERACKSIGHSFVAQLGKIFLDLLNVYRYYSDQVSTFVGSGVPYAADRADVGLMKGVKRDVLNLIITFIDKCEDSQLILKTFLPPLMDAVFSDYAHILPDTRSSEVLVLASCLIKRLKASMTSHVDTLFEAIIKPTVPMLTRNFIDYPEIRIQFFKFLRALNENCFQGMMLH